MKAVSENNVGKTIKQSTGYNAYFPHKLSSGGPKGINYTHELFKLSSEADRALGELNGITKFLKNPDLFVAFYVKKEALLSSQIEGTQCSLDEVLEVDENSTELKPVDEVVNYIKAMNTGLEKLKNLPFSIRLIKEIHSILMQGVRGQNKLPGEFKTTQNWIGPAGSTLSEAVFIPTPPDMTTEWMGGLENYYHEEDTLPVLIKAAVLYFYFETIHPFADGNGRLGRLLITFLLCEKEILDKPLLYLSLFFKEHKNTYYELLMNVRLNGDWNEWIKFFLRGVRNTSLEAIDTAKELIQLIEKQKDIISKEISNLSYASRVHDILCENPIMSISKLSKDYDIPYPTAKRTILAFADKEIVKLDEAPGGTVAIMESYISVLRRGTN